MREARAEYAEALQCPKQQPSWAVQKSGVHRRQRRNGPPQSVRPANSLPSPLHRSLNL